MNPPTPFFLSTSVESIMSELKRLSKVRFIKCIIVTWGIDMRNKTIERVDYMIMLKRVSRYCCGMGIIKRARSKTNDFIASVSWGSLNGHIFIVFLIFLRKREITEDTLTRRVESVNLRELLNDATTGRVTMNVGAFRAIVMFLNYKCQQIKKIMITGTSRMRALCSAVEMAGISSTALCSCSAGEGSEGIFRNTETPENSK